MVKRREPFSVIRSWKLEMADEKGNRRFIWLTGYNYGEGTLRGGPSLRMIDRNGEHRVSLGINRDNQPELSIIHMPGEDSEYRNITASLEADGTPYVHIYNRAREFREVKPPNSQTLN